MTPEKHLSALLVAWNESGGKFTKDLEEAFKNAEKDFDGWEATPGDLREELETPVREFVGYIGGMYNLGALNREGVELAASTVKRRFIKRTIGFIEGNGGKIN